MPSVSDPAPPRLSDAVRRVVDAFLAETAPDTSVRDLYHYTDLSGLCGLLESNHFRGTYYSFLNDRSEFRYADELFRTAIGALASLHPFEGGDETELQTADEFRAGFIHALQSVMASGGVPLTKVPYVACFSEHDDVLSQWRAYGDNGRGYALRFDKDELARSAGAVAKLWRVIYDPLAQRRLVDTLLGSIINAIVEDCFACEKPEDHAAVAQGYIQQFIALYALLSMVIKHPAFSEEREWRLVFQGPDIQQIDRAAKASSPLSNEEIERLSSVFSVVRTRPGRAGLTPYVEIPFSVASSVREVVVGPGLDGPLAVPALQLHLLKSGFLATMGVRHSQVPYRP